jgi:hypothetical protein
MSAMAALSFAGLCAKYHTAFEQKCPKLVDHRRAPGDQAITDPMDALQVQLIISLDRDKAHVLAFNCFRDGLGIDEVILVRLHEGFYKLGCNQPDIVALLPQCTSEKVRSRAGLQPDQRCLHVRGVV